MPLDIMAHNKAYQQQPSASQRSAIDAPAPATPRPTRVNSLRKPRTSPSKSKSLPQLPRDATALRSSSPFASNQHAYERSHSQPVVSPRSPGATSTTSCQNSTSACGSTDSHTALITRSNSTTKHSLAVPSSFSRHIQLSPGSRQQHTLTKQHSSPNMHAPSALADNRDARTSQTLSPRARRQLIRSTRKLSKILGETPILPGSLENGDWTDCAEDDEFGVSLNKPATAHSLSSRHPMSPTSAARAALTFGTRPSNINMHALGSSNRADLTGHSLTVPSSADAAHISHTSREPPLLKVDCSFSERTSRRFRPRTTLSPLSDNTDALSILSNSTATSGAGTDLFSLSSSRRHSSKSGSSPLSPASSAGMLTPTQALLVEKERQREARRSKVAKLSRYYGEHVPAELIFRNESSQQERGDVMVERKGSPRSRTSAAAAAAAGSPTRMSSLMRRRNQYYSRARNPLSPLAHHVSSYTLRESAYAGTTAAATSNARLLTRSASVRVSANASEMVVTETGLVRRGTKRKAVPQLTNSQVLALESDKDADVETKVKHTREADPLSPTPKFSLSSPETAYVRRSNMKKVESIFGEVPPASAFGIARRTLTRRNSTNSVVSTASNVPKLHLPSTPLAHVTVQTPISPTPTPTAGEALSPRTLRRRSSLSAIPDTPPPFSHYLPPLPTAEPVKPKKSVPVLRLQLEPIIKQPSRYLHPFAVAQPTGSTTSLTPVQTEAQKPDSPLVDPINAITTRTRPSTPDSFHSSPSDGDDDSDVDSDESRERRAAAFRERRLRANKLAKFFGVGYGDIVPALTSDSSISGASSTRPSAESSNSASARGAGEHGARKGEKSRMPPMRESGVSITVSKEVDDVGRYSISANPDPLVKSTRKGGSNRDSVDPASGGCYPGFAAAAAVGTSPAKLARSLSMRRKAAPSPPFHSILATNSKENVSRSSGEEPGGSRSGSSQGHGLGGGGRAPSAPHYQTTSTRMRNAIALAASRPRSDSPDKMYTGVGSPLTFSNTSISGNSGGEKDKAPNNPNMIMTSSTSSSSFLPPIAPLRARPLSRISQANDTIEASMAEFGLGEPAVFVSRSDSLEKVVGGGGEGRAGAGGGRKGKHVKGVGSIVRVGSREADVNAVMGRLRELR